MIKHGSGLADTRHPSANAGSGISGNTAPLESTVAAFARVPQTECGRHRALSGRHMSAVAVDLDDKRDRVTVVDLPARLKLGERAGGDAVTAVEPEPAGVHPAGDELSVVGDACRHLAQLVLRGASEIARQADASRRTISSDGLRRRPLYGLVCGRLRRSVAI